MKSIALFGGSFDPIHRGHLEVVKSAREETGINEVMFMPCWVSPFKTKTIASGQQRYRMIELAIEEIGIGEWASVSDYEITREERSYSWQTVSYLREVHPEVKWYWILGTDQWSMIEKWAEPEKLQEWLDFIVLTRGGSEVEDREGWRFQAIEFDHPASSSQIRAEYRERGDWLPDQVKAYCDQEGIY